MLNLSSLTCKSALQRCLWIYLDCLTAVKSNLFGPQDCLKRCKGGHQGELIPFLGIPLALTMLLSGELLFPFLALVGVYWPQGKMMVQILDASGSNLMAIAFKCYCRGLVNSCSTVLIFGSW
jgi:hypothetical protein